MFSARRTDGWMQQREGGGGSRIHRNVSSAQHRLTLTYEPVMLFYLTEYARYVKHEQRHLTFIQTQQQCVLLKNSTVSCCSLLTATSFTLMCFYHFINLSHPNKHWHCLLFSILLPGVFSGLKKGCAFALSTYNV